VEVPEAVRGEVPERLRREGRLGTEPGRWLAREEAPHLRLRELARLRLVAHGLLPFPDRQHLGPVCERPGEVALQAAQRVRALRDDVRRGGADVDRVV